MPSPANSWSVPLANGERLAFIRDSHHFPEDRAGTRQAEVSARFSQKVVSAQTFISGFNMTYTREDHDHEVTSLRVDSWVKKIGSEGPEFPDDNVVFVELTYALTDEDTSDDDDFNTCWIGYTVSAHTKP